MRKWRLIENMTVVCYRNGILAADSLFVIDDSTKCPIGTVKKIFQRGHFIYAFAGCPFNIMNYINAFNVSEPLDDDATIIEFRKDSKTFYEISSKGSLNIGIPEFFAIGSGAEAALGALYMGATAIEAVEAACNVNIFCGLPVEHIRLWD